LPENFNQYPTKLTSVRATVYGCTVAKSVKFTLVNLSDIIDGMVKNVTGFLLTNRVFRWLQSRQQPIPGNQEN
jgi:hypothetical protein